MYDRTSKSSHKQCAHTHTRDRALYAVAEYYEHTSLLLSTKRAERARKKRQTERKKKKKRKRFFFVLAIRDMTHMHAAHGTSIDG